VSSPRNAAAAGAAIVRWLGFLCLWLILSGITVTDLVVGATTAVAAAWASLHLLPPARRWPRPLALASLVARFISQSAIAGADVARRALAPALPLRPGLVRCPLRLAPGPAQSAFCAFSSLLPGTLVVGSEPDGALCVHCLDLGQDIPAQMRAEETAFLAAAGRPADG
jgi:multicomponent Na+:H+ antiporter subunit E